MERRFGWLAIPNLTYYLLIGQVITYIFVTLNPQYANFLSLSGQQVLKGEWWRLFLFLFTPIVDSPIFAALVWYIFYLYGTALEKYWGSFRYLIYILILYLLTMVAAFLFPAWVLGNTHIYTSIFLAFAYLYPDFTLYLFFILPVKVKWLALFLWVWLGVGILTGNYSVKIMSLLTVTNFLLFFGNDLINSTRLKTRSATIGASRHLTSPKAYHVCWKCKRNEVADPDMQILYCKDCVPSTCYCEKHIDNHTHRKS